MKVNSDELALLRTYPHATKLYLGVQQGETLLTGQADGDHAQGATSILLRDVVCDDPSELRYGMSVSIGERSDHNRKVSAMFVDYDEGTLTITLAPNAETATDGEYVVVYSTMRLWKVNPPAWDGSQHIPPIAILGPMRAGFVNEPLNFIGANSYSPVGRTLTNPQWHFFDDASVVSGNTSALNTVDEPLVVTYPTTGEKLVRLKVEDSEGEVTRSLRPVLIFDRPGGDNPPYSQVKINSMRGDRSQGWTLNITVYGAADADEFPPAAQIIIWAEDWYGDTKQSIGCLRGQGEVIFTGWIRQGTTKVSADEQSVTFDADSIDWLVRQLTMPDFTFRDGDDVTDWYKFDDLTLGKALLHIVQQECTLTRICDVFTATFDYQVDKLPVPAGSLMAQLAQSILPACFGYAAGSRFGSLTLARDKNVIDATMRAKLKRASITFTPADWLDLVQSDTPFHQTALVRVEGRLGNNTPVAAQYPTSGPGHDGALVTLSNLIFKDSDQAADSAELLYKRDNVNVKGITLRLPNYRMLEPAFQEYFTVYLPDSYTNRGTNYVGEQNGISGREFMCESMAIAFAEGYLLVTITGKPTVSLNWTPNGSFTPQDVYGYDQAPGMGTGTDTDTLGDFLTDDSGNTLTDDSGNRLLDG